MRRLRSTLLGIALLTAPAFAQSGVTRPNEAHRTSPRGTDADTPPGNGGAAITPDHNYYEPPDETRPGEHNFGWMGLLGLAGLAGRFRPNRSNEVEHRDTARSQPEGFRNE